MPMELMDTLQIMVGIKMIATISKPQEKNQV